MHPPPNTLIRILVVDDSSLARKLLSLLINEDPRFIVVSAAADGREAISLMPVLKPDLILMDINMPRMDGFEATKWIMAHQPTPILIVTSSLYRDGVNQTLKALSYGALDVFEKNQIEVPAVEETVKAELLERMYTLARVPVLTHPVGKLTPPAPPADQVARLSGGWLVAIAGSTGGPQALLKILKTFPKNTPLTFLVVQHISPGFSAGLAEWLDHECQLTVTQAASGMRQEPATVYIAPAGAQTRIADDRTIRVSDAPAAPKRAPSADVLFESIAKVYGPRAIGIILSGMGKDGAAGLKTLKDAGGVVLAQDEATSVIFGMAKAAVDAGAVDFVLPVDRIPDTILHIAGRLSEAADRPRPPA